MQLGVFGEIDYGICELRVSFPMVSCCQMAQIGLLMAALSRAKFAQFWRSRVDVRVGKRARVHALHGTTVAVDRNAVIGRRFRGI